MKTQNYKSLIVWQRAIELVLAVYKLTENFPGDERYALTSQIQRSAISIPSNIAEGKLRSTEPEFKRYLLIAYGSAGELETQIIIAKQLSKTRKLDYSVVDEKLSEVMKMIYKLIEAISG